MLGVSFMTPVSAAVRRLMQGTSGNFVPQFTVGVSDGGAFEDSTGGRVPTFNSTTVSDTILWQGKKTIRFGTGFMYFQDSPIWHMGSKDFRVRTALRFPAEAIGARMFVCGQATTGAQDLTFLFRKSTADQLAFIIATDTGTYTATFATPVVADTWYCIEGKRVGSEILISVGPDFDSLVAGGSAPCAGSLIDRATLFALGQLGEYTGYHLGETGVILYAWMGHFSLDVAP